SCILHSPISTTGATAIVLLQSVFVLCTLYLILNSVIELLVNSPWSIVDPVPTLFFVLGSWFFQLIGTDLTGKEPIRQRHKIKGSECSYGQTADHAVYQGPLQVGTYSGTENHGQQSQYGGNGGHQDGLQPDFPCF